MNLFSIWHKDWTFFIMTQRIENDSLKELNPLFQNDSMNWSLSKNDSKIWTFISSIWHIESFLHHSTNWTFFLRWLKELNFLLYMTQRIEPFFKTSQRLEPFLFKKKNSKNWTFFFLKKNWTISSIWER